MNVPLVVAGVFAVLAAAVHGGAGEMLVVRKLSLETLPATRFGGPTMTKAMIQASWHLTTAAFLAVGVGLLLAGSVLDGDAAKGIGFLAAAAFTSFAAVVVVGGAANTRSLRGLLHHPGPAMLAATAALAWWGVLTL